MSAYSRSFLMKYMEEALAECYAQLRVNGITALPVGIRFPVANGYMTLSQLYLEGAALGTVIIGTTQFVIRFVASDGGTGANSSDAGSN